MINKSLKPLQHNECQKTSKYLFQEKVGPPCRKMHLEAKIQINNGHIPVWAPVIEVDYLTNLGICILSLSICNSLTYLIESIATVRIEIALGKP